MADSPRARRPAGRLPALLLLLLAPLLPAAAAPAAAAGESFAILYNDTRNDGGFNESAVLGLQRFKAEFGVDVRENIIRTEAESLRSMRNFARWGIRNILLIGFVNEPAVAQVAREYPEVRFTLIDGVVELPNVRSVLFREEEAAYLVGTAAALASRSGIVGFLGGMPIPPIRRFECGFRQGAAAAGRPARVIARYLGEGPEVFRDRSLSRVEAQRMLGEGADVVFAAAGLGGAGALDAAAAAGRLGIGVDTNQNGRHPGQVLTSAVKRVDVTVHDAFRDAMLGTWTAGVQRVGLAEQAVGWARDRNNESLVEELAPRLDAVADALAKGALRLDPACS